MKKNMIKFLGLPLLAFVAINCAVITVNIYFPTEAVEEAAEKIIDEIEGGEDAQAETGSADQQGFLQRTIPFSIFSNATVYADDIDMEITTPAIRKVIATMKSRNSEIMDFKDKGVLGETNSGMLDIRDMTGLRGEEIRTVKRLLRAENDDRETLYRELAVANKIELSEVDRIKKIFAKTRKQKAKSGHWHQDEEGNWIQK